REIGRPRTTDVGLFLDDSRQRFGTGLVAAFHSIASKRTASPGLALIVCNTGERVSTRKGSGRHGWHARTSQSGTMLQTASSDATPAPRGVRDSNPERTGGSREECLRDVLIGQEAQRGHVAGSTSVLRSRWAAKAN